MKSLSFSCKAITCLFVCLFNVLYDICSLNFPSVFFHPLFNWTEKHSDETQQCGIPQGLTTNIDSIFELELFFGRFSLQFFHERDTKIQKKNYAMRAQSFFLLLPSFQLFFMYNVADFHLRIIEKVKLENSFVQ